ncbi:MAG: tRNA 5-hydroxyuridine modification protein YegQ [Methanoregulaceae archaeon]|nr:tRNA 5-hydroxyuridine modification protein YegQ [Methanoregulaceae archaeon]
MQKTPELLLPAGSLEKMRYAFAYGADAVYAGQPRYSLRARNNEFGLSELETGIREAHGSGRKFYVTSNLMAHNSKVKTFERDIAPVIAMGPDALIMADPGLIMLVRERWPEMPVHLSVQANTVNYAAVRFWHSLGLSRIILSRELSLDEIAEIRQQCPEMELEVFVHGALCIAYSGRCLLSGYFNHRDANQGTCTNSCRWDYKVHEAQEDPAGIPRLAERHPQSEQVFLLEEGKRPGELMPIEEDEHGTYILNSKDLRAVEHVAKLVELGVDSLKIEGRTKSVYYVTRTTQAYRLAIDDAVAGRPFDPAHLAALENLANRGYTGGFFQRHPDADTQNYLTGQSESGVSQYVGDIVSYDPDAGLAEVVVKNRFAVGDQLELIQPSGNRVMQLEQMFDRDGRLIPEAPGNGWVVRIPLRDVTERAMLARLL